MKIKKILIALMLVYSGSALADGASELIDTMLKKGILTEEEAKKISQEFKTDKKSTEKPIIKVDSSDEAPIKFYGTIRTYLDYDNINTTPKQSGERVTNFISKIGFKFKEPINIANGGWVINGKYETSWFTDNPRSMATYIGDQESTVGIASNYVDSLAGLKLDIGRKPHTVWQSFKTYGIFSDAFGTPLGEIHSRQGLFFNNGIFLQSKPSQIPGLTLNADYSLSEKVDIPNKMVYGAKYEWSNYSLAAYRFDDKVNNETNILMGSINFPDQKFKVTGMLSDDLQTGGAFPSEGLKTKGFSTQVSYYLTPDLTILPGYGHRSDGVNAYTLGADYKLNKRTTLQIHGQRVISDDPIVFTTANDIGPLFNYNGGVAAGTGSSRTQIGIGLQYWF